MGLSHYRSCYDSFFNTRRITGDATHMACEVVTRNCSDRSCDILFCLYTVCCNDHLRQLIIIRRHVYVNFTFSHDLYFFRPITNKRKHKCLGVACQWYGIISNGVGDRAYRRSFDHDIYSGKSLAFCIDDTSESEALVPDRFRALHFTRAPNGEPAPDFLRRMQELLHGRRTA